MGAPSARRAINASHQGNDQKEAYGAASTRACRHEESVKRNNDGHLRRGRNALRANAAPEMALIAAASAADRALLIVDEKIMSPKRRDQGKASAGNNALKARYKRCARPESSSWRKKRREGKGRNAAAASTMPLSSKARPAAASTNGYACHSPTGGRPKEANLLAYNAHRPGLKRNADAAHHHRHRHHL